MKPSNIKKLLKEVVQSVRKNPAIRRRDDTRYAIVAKIGYEEIQSLRNDGYTYNLICDGLIAKGVLDCVCRSSWTPRAGEVGQESR